AGDQLTVFLLICALAFAAFVPFVLRSGEIRLIATLMLFGLLGAAFSAVQSMMKERNDLRIPERVANYFVTVTRVLFGAVVAVAAAALYESLVLNVNIGDPKMVLALCVSFLVGCIGERLLARIAESMSDRRSRS
ncbi:MAG TPA: hypothetical protein VEW69_05785, partial [Alphaproteobacteria bacterium]|nr:hypothetical protein [Alphaproteobacteria bacterium]